MLTCYDISCHCWRPSASLTVPHATAFFNQLVEQKFAESAGLVTKIYQPVGSKSGKRLVLSEIFKKSVVVVIGGGSSNREGWEVSCVWIFALEKFSWPQSECYSFFLGGCISYTNKTSCQINNYSHAAWTPGRNKKKNSARFKRLILTSDGYGPSPRTAGQLERTFGGNVGYLSSRRDLDEDRQYWTSPPILFVQSAEKIWSSR